jgi:rubrerythrin
MGAKFISGPLTTFGAVLKYALELEAIAAAFYETASTITSTQNLRSVFEALIFQGQKRIQTLMRVRRENTTEMILEPISGLDGNAYHPTTECPESCTDDALIQLAKAMEIKISSFYTSAAEKVSFLSEAADIFERLADEHTENQNALDL